jgi:hypothetical protein
LLGLVASSLEVVERGIDEGIVFVPSSASGLGIGGYENVCWDGLEESGVDGRVDDLLALHQRDVFGIASLACRRWGGFFESSEALLPESGRAERARLGWLNFLKT